MVKRTLALAVLCTFLAANAWAYPNNIEVRWTAPSVVAGTCSQMGTISLRFDNGTIWDKDESIEMHLLPGVTLCRGIDFYIRIPGGQYDKITEGPLQGSYNTVTGGPCLLHVSGQEGKGFIYLRVLEGSLQSTDRYAPGMNLVLFDNRSAPDKLMRGAYSDGVFTSSGDVSDEENALYANIIEDYRDRYVRVALDSSPSKFLFNPSTFDLAVVTPFVKQLFPYFGDAPFWNGVALTNVSYKAMNATLTVVDDMGGTGKVTVEVPSRGMYVKLLKDLMADPAFTGNATFGRRCFIEMSTEKGDLAGFAMMGNTRESLGYVVDIASKESPLGEGEMLFPYFADKASGFWNGLALTNTGKEPVDAMIAVVDEAGGAAVVPVTVPARGMYVTLIDELLAGDNVDPSGTAPDPNKRCFVTVKPYTGSKKLTGFAMMGNGMESMGYTVR